jgi:UDP-glucose 4-epimerase
MNWHGSDVIVTGGASFIGSHLVEVLVRNGARVEVIDNLSSGSLENLAEVEDKIQFHRIDLHDASLLELSSLLKRKYVFHLAAEHGGRGYVDTHPVESLFNIQLDQNVFWSAWKAGVKKIVYASSGCVYPPRFQLAKGYDKLKEEYQSWKFADPKPVDNEYGQAKLLGEALLKYLNQTKRLATVSARLFSVYGPREPENQSIIAFIARAFINQDPFEIWGDGTQIRNYTFVSDIVDGIVRLAEEIADGSTFNVGSDEVISVREAVEMTCEMIGHKPRKFVLSPSAPTGPHSRVCDYTTIYNRLGWKPNVSFREGLRKTVNWYTRTHDLADVRERLDVLLFERGVAKQTSERIIQALQP